jgi:cytochrome c oxidase subunit IV
MAEHQHHVTPIWQYLLVFAALLVSTGLTVAASLVDLTPLVHFAWANDLVAMTIAIIKALLVLLVFMELRHSTRMTALTAAAGFFWLVLMLSTFMMDYGTRVATVLPVPGK